MASSFQDILNRFKSLSSQPAIRQLQLLVGLAASISLGIGLVDWARTPNYVPLYGEVSRESFTEVVAALEAKGVRYQMDSRSGLISVPSEQLHDVRVQLAAEGLPRSQSNGFEVLDKDAGMGVSSFMERARFDRALEQELAHSIASLDSVRSARVHLALPAQSAFVRKRNKAAASVLVSLYGGRELSDSQLAGIVHLVAFSVPGLEAEQVSVVDNNGQLLSTQNRNGFSATTTENFHYTQKLEASYVDRITRILSPILGIGAVRAQVTADVDFTAVERTSEVYSPERSVRSEQLYEELSSDNRAAGIPGTLANQPVEEPPLVDQAELGEPTANGTPARSSKRELRNYELDRTISHTRENPGVLRRLSVAVVVDYRDEANEEGESRRAPLAQAQLDEVTALVKEAVGFDASRGDTVNVVNASFVAPPEVQPLPAIPLLEQEWVWRAAKYLLVAGAVLSIIVVVLRPLLRTSVEPPVIAQPLAVGSGAEAGAAVNGLSDDRVTLGAEVPATGVPMYQQQLSMARELVEGEPERVARVVKGWVSSDG